MKRHIFPRCGGAEVTYAYMQNTIDLAPATNSCLTAIGGPALAASCGYRAGGSILKTGILPCAMSFVWARDIHQEAHDAVAVLIAAERGHT
jgi:formate hydrogenlyase subunit 3/multisubunit Na+/H+ antiporter MnhD subunit